MLENAPLELAQLRPRLEPELVRKPVPGCLQRSESVRMSPRAIKRKHQLTEQSLPQWMLVDEALELGHEFGAGTHREPRVEQIFARHEPLLLQPTGFATCERLVENIRQCRPGPKGLSLTQQSSRTLDVTRHGGCHAHPVPAPRTGRGRARPG